MAHASEPVGTIDPKEAAHFGKMAAEWWDPRGSSALLHQMHPVRLGYIRDQIDHHWQLDEHDRNTLAGRRALAMVSGAGVTDEPRDRDGTAIIDNTQPPGHISRAGNHTAGQR